MAAGVRLRVSDPCQGCGAVGTVRIEQTLKGDTVTFMWCCRACDHEWRITEDDHLPEHRKAPADRRKVTRKERRSK